MPTPCTICTSPEREHIDHALQRNQPLSAIASSFRVTPSSLRRHRDTHLRRAIADAQQLQNTKLLERVNEIYAQTAVVLKDSRDRADIPNTLRALQRLERQVHLAAILTTRSAPAEPDRPTSKDFVNFRHTLMAALEPFPDAYRSVAQAFRRKSAAPAAPKQSPNRREAADFSANLNNPKATG